MTRITCAVLLLAAMTLNAPGQSFDTLATFENVNGRAPYAISLAQGRDGNLYGTTSLGGANGSGTIFRITSVGELKTLYSFCSLANCVDGVVPYAGLILASDGNFYGTTFSGGAYRFGTVFKVTPGGILTTLYSFCPAGDLCADGQYPVAPLVQATDGSFYGTTSAGGARNGGTLFKLTPTGVFETLHTFDLEGAVPYAGLIQGVDGNLYGTTTAGGHSGGGTIFKLTRGRVFVTLYPFCSQQNCSDGREPFGSLVQATHTDFYGTTLYGGSKGQLAGTVFQITANGALTTLYSFCSQPSCADGQEPRSGLTQGTDAKLYGTTSNGGIDGCFFNVGCGTLFTITRDGAFVSLRAFAFSDGASPVGTLFQATNGRFYGAAAAGGDSACNAPVGCGTIFSLDMGLGPFITFVHGAGKVGQTGGILGQGFTGTTSVLLNGTPADFTVVSDTYIRAAVPAGATSGHVTVTTPGGTLTSNVPFHVIR